MARYDTNGSSALAPNDPYNDMEGAEIRPDFGVINGGKTSKSQNTSNRSNFKVLDGGKSNASKELLRNSENSALKGEPTFNSGWRNNVSGLGKPQNDKNSKKGGISLNGKKKGIAASGVIIGIIVTIIVALGGSHAMLGPAMSSILTGKSDFRYTATYSQWGNNKFMKAVMNRSQGTNNKPMDFSDDFIENLKTFDIEVNDNGSNYTFTYKGQTITGDNFSDTFNNDANFRTAFTNAKQGRAANFFDNKATIEYNHYNITRNELKNFQDTGNIDTDTENYNKIQSQKFDKQTVEITTTHAEEKEQEVKDANGNTVTDADGKPQTTTVIENERNETAVSDTSSSTDIEVAKTKASSFISKIGTVTNVLNWGCTAMRTGNMVIKTASAMQRISSILYFMGIMESISKMMAGDGSQAGYNALMNFLVGPAIATIADYTKANASVSYDESEGNLSVNIGETTVSGSPVQSNLTSILSYSPLNKELAKNFSFSSMAALFTGAFGFTTMKAAGCAISNIGESVASLAINLLPGGQGIKIVGGTIFKAIFIGIASYSIGSILGFLIPYVAKSLFMNDWLSRKGIEAGEEIIRGAMASNGSLAQSAGNGFGTNEEAVEFSRITNTVLAMEAESDRINRNPFDINSKNTFLGSIAYNLLATTIASNGYSALKSLVGTTSRSIASLTNGAYADGIDISDGTNIINEDNDCGFSNLLKDKDGNGPTAAGTAWCTTLPVTSAKVLNTDPTSQDLVDTINSELEYNSSTNKYELKKTGDLAKFTSYCLYRDSEPDETPDARILSELHSTPSLLSTASSFFPLASDVVNIIDGFDDLANIGWATGETCYLHRNKDIYKAYAIQEGLYEQTMAGSDGELAYVSPITEYIEEYNAEHPINSTTDLIARHAGLTTEDTELVIALAEYYDFINEYEPGSRIAINNETNQQITGEEPITDFINQELHIKNTDKQTTLPVIIATSQHIIYADIRNRSYAV